MGRALAAALAITASVGACSLESEWQPRERDAAVDRGDALEDVRTDIAASDVDVMDADVDVTETGVDVMETGVDVMETGVDVTDAVVDTGDACAAIDASVGPSTQRSCASSCTPGCGVVAVTGGAFTMGGAESAAGGRALTNVQVSSFSIDAYEVTVARFQQFWNGARPAMPEGPIPYPNGAFIPTAGWAVTEPGSTGDCNWGRSPMRDAHPVNCITRAMAQAFCYWDAGGRGRGGRLPTSAEWEYVAEGWASPSVEAPPRLYPWGAAAPDAASCDVTDLRRAQLFPCPGEDSARTLRVRPHAVVGVYDLAGNVSEWVADDRTEAGYNDICWWRSSRHNPLCRTAALAGGDRFVIRGGDFGTGAARARNNVPGRAASQAYESVGFRCVRAPVATPPTNDTGTTACPSGQVRCGADCVDPLVSSSNCGRCGASCAASQACNEGRCVEAQRSCAAAASTTGCGMGVVGAGRFNVLAGDATTAQRGVENVGVSAFALDEYEVSVARFRRFWSEVSGPTTPQRPPASMAYPGGGVPWVPEVSAARVGGLLAPISDRECVGFWSPTPGTPAEESRPMACIDWWTAQAFCFWDSSNTGGRLPTRAEWEFAARGTERINLEPNRAWPWGDDSDICTLPRARFNFCSTMGAAAVGSTAPPYGGFFDMSGNVAEWVADARPFEVGLADCWGASGDGGVLQDPVCARPSGDAYIPGGVFAVTTIEGARLGTRGGSGSSRAGSYDTGFRCARSVTP